MYKYTVEGYNSHGGLVTDRIQIVVTAPTESAARTRAAEISPRTNYSLVGVEDLQEARTIQKVEPTKSNQPKQFTKG